jgi:hypothetical protein
MSDNWHAAVGLENICIALLQQYVFSAEIIKTVMKLRFYAIFNDFILF